MLHAGMQQVTVARVTDAAVIQPLHLNDQVYEAVRARLLTREFGPGTRLGLQALADELAVSRSPVQHALTRLVTEGLVEVDRRGYRPRAMTPKLMAEAHGVRCALELFAADQTVGHVSAEQLERLRSRLEHTVDLVEDFEFVDKHEYMLANKAFHEYLVDLAGNGLLSHTYRALSLHELMERVLAGPTRAAGNSSEEHRRIVEAYEAGDLPAARAAIIANVETGKQLAIEVIEASGGVL
jgi:DNA-binding GntR family transcriptional regulator